MEIQISGQYGDPKADNLFWPWQKRLNGLFKEHMLGEYFRTLVKLSIVFRVSGQVTDFGAEGPERLNYIRKDCELTIDLVFPEDHWRGVNPEKIKTRIRRGIEDCITIFVERAEELGEMLERDAFLMDARNALSEL